MTNQSKLHPGEFSRDIAKWQRGVIADIKQLTRGIARGNQVYLPQIVLAERPRRVIRVTACQAPENMRMKDDSYVCWKDSSGTLVASPKANWSTQDHCFQESLHFLGRRSQRPNFVRTGSYP